MAFTAVSDRLKVLGAKLDAQMPDIISTISMVELEAQWKQRIFGEGKNSDGSDIGQYSTKSAYYAKSQFIRKAAFKPIGKNGGKTKSTMYLSKGYSEFRDIQGRETDNVNLKFSGSLERAFRVFKFGNESLLANADEKEHLKVEGLEDRFGDWASLTESEKQFLRDNITDQVVIIAKS